MAPKTLRSIVTAAAIGLAVLHRVNPDFQLDAVTVILLVVAVGPWLTPLLKSVELPGGFKVEFQDQLQKAAENAARAGLLAPGQRPPDRPRHSFELVADEDPNLALAGLRIEIERRLSELAASRQLKVNRAGVGSLLRELRQARAITPEESSVLQDMIGLLNSAVHGQQVDDRAAAWALEIGPRVLDGLARRVGQRNP